MSLPSLTEDQELWINSLVPLIRQGIITFQPHSGFSTGSGKIFTGSYDWHSCVHAHWALLSIARLTLNKEIESFLEARLKPEAIEEEARFLADPKNRDFETPYGRAWLLLLLAELERRPWGKFQAAQKLRLETEDLLLAWLKSTPFPDLKNFPPPKIDNPWQDFRGDHHSWLFPLLLISLSQPQRKAIRDQLQDLKRTRVEPLRDRLKKNDDTVADFLHIPSILGLIERLDLANPVSDPIAPRPLEFRFPIDGRVAHTAGANATRLWIAAWDTKERDTEAEKLYWSGMNEFLRHPEQWSEDFRFVSHWVPQFLWMGLWIEQGAL